MNNEDPKTNNPEQSGLRILFLTHYWPPELNAPASRTFEHCRQWARSGHQVTVLTCAPNHPQGVLYPGYRNRLWQEESIEGIRVLRVWTFLAPNKGRIRRSLNYLSYLSSVLVASLFLKRQDLIIATSPQFFCGLSGAILSLFRRETFVLEIRDIWPASIAAVGALHLRPLLGFLGLLERFMYRRAQHIVTVGDGYKTELERRGVSSTKLSVIPNGIDFDSFSATPTSAPAPCLQALAGRFVCAYVGTIGMAHGLDILLRAARVLKEERDSSLAFLAVGDGAEQDRLCRKAQWEGLDNVLFPGAIPREKIPSLLSSVGCVLVHLRRADLFKSVLPSKIFEAMALKKPIILGVEGEAAKLIEKADAGICIEPENEQQLLTALRQLRDDSALTNRLGEHGWHYVQKHFDRKRNAALYLSLLERVAKRTQGLEQTLLASSLRFLRTAFHLRPSQLFYRLRYRLELARASQKAATLTIPPLLPALREDFPTKLPPAFVPTKAKELIDDLARGELCLLNIRKPVGRESLNWYLGPQQNDRLWVSLLHSMQWLVVLAERWHGGDKRAKKLLLHALSSWLSCCSYPTREARHLAWNSFALASRLSSWVRCYLLIGKKLKEEESTLHDKLLCSLYAQAQYLERHLAWDLRANHLFRDATGLALAGRFFQGTDAVRWLKKAERLALCQVEEQLLPDGVHFELSPMYQLQVMEDLLLMIELSECADVRSTLTAAWAQLLYSLSALRHPDGHIALLNDATLNGALAPAEFFAQASQLGLELPDCFPQGEHYFPDAGIVAWHDSNWSVFFDIGTIGPRYQPGHAHADTLSIECSYRGQRLFVDPGCYGYDDDEHRHYDRSSAAHNTVTIDSLNSSEVWSIFRVGRRARVRDCGVSLTSQRFRAQATHNGYTWLPGSPRHRRELSLDNAGTMRISDSITGSASHLLSAGLLLAPGWKVESSANGWLLQKGALSLVVTLESSATLNLSLIDALYHPEFGREESVKRLQWSCKAALPLEVTTVVSPQ